MDLCSKGERGVLLKEILKISTTSGFSSAVDAVSEAVTYGALDVDSLKAIHTRMMMPVLKSRPLNLPENVPSLDRIKSNAHLYDEILKKAGGLSC